MAQDDWLRTFSSQGLGMVYLDPYIERILPRGETEVVSASTCNANYVVHRNVQIGSLSSETSVAVNLTLTF